ncbi:MAG: glycosyltransferase [Planctomycetota bacterium]|jgi:GT2 family glycosyltransferase
MLRPQVRGKFFFVGEEKLYVKGVTYGAFQPNADGVEYHDLDRIASDFAAMARSGFNTVRIPHTTPPRAVLDIAQEHGLRVMVGLSAEQYVGYLADGWGRRLKLTAMGTAPDVVRRVREKARSVAGHPALLCYALGNEIPAPLVRWLGPHRVARYLRKLWRAVKAEDPQAIVTYVNYPTTEYLDLPFLDVVSFNVYLEQQENLSRYLGRLQNLAGDRPLLMSEVGLDAVRNGEDKQAEVLAWQVSTSFSCGCAGVVLFSWTDEWFRAGEQVEDWAFGLTDRDRNPKPALAAVQMALVELPLAKEPSPPRFSVIVCTYNGARTLRRCLMHLVRLDYPNYEVVVVNDGSTDESAAIAHDFKGVRGFDVHVISTPNQGLSAARNLGLDISHGELVVYIDDDAFPDEHWLTYLAAEFQRTDHVGIGGPNIEPPDEHPFARCVANSPGGPAHVLITDQLAEHIPGCNMAFHRKALLAVGGFDPQFRAAGDDVDLCWRLQERGWTLGFCPAAMVWHHRRQTTKSFWKQQVGYGRAEAILTGKWPQRFNSAGHHTFAGRIYCRALRSFFKPRVRVYHGVWGTAPFQGVYEQRTIAHFLPMMPEWYLQLAFLAVLSLLGILWRPLLLALVPLGAGMALTLAQAVRGARAARFPPCSSTELLSLRVRTGLLHLLQPLARLWGSMQAGNGFWRSRGGPVAVFPRVRESAVWTEDWVAPEARLTAVAQVLQTRRARVDHGDGFQAWDIEVSGGMLGAARLLVAVEDHGGGTQYVRTRAWPRLRRRATVAVLTLMVLGGLAVLHGSWIAALVLVSLAALVGLVALRHCAVANAMILDALDGQTTGS